MRILRTRKSLPIDSILKKRQVLNFRAAGEKSKKLLWGKNKNGGQCEDLKFEVSR